MIDQVTVFQEPDQPGGIRITYTGHIRNVVQTSVYQTTRENYEACLRAIAALEGVSYENLIALLNHEASAFGSMLKVETYHAH